MSSDFSKPHFQDVESSRLKFNSRLLSVFSLVRTEDEIVCSHAQPARIIEFEYPTWKPRLSRYKKYQIFNRQAPILLKNMSICLKYYIGLFF